MTYILYIYNKTDKINHGLGKLSKNKSYDFKGLILIINIFLTTFSLTAKVWGHLVKESKCARYTGFEASRA